MHDLNIKATQEVIVIIGESGGDGGGWIVTPNGLKRIPDNNPELREALKVVVKNYSILKRGVAQQEVVR